MAAMENGPVQQPQDDDGGMYGVFGEGKPRKILGDSDEPPRRRPRTKPSAPAPSAELHDRDRR